MRDSMWSLNWSFSRRGPVRLRLFVLSAAALLLAVGASTPLAAAQAQPQEADSARRIEPEPPPAIEREFRGVWISPVNSGRINDWPSHPGLSADEQKAELVTMLDRARDIGLNAVILHVRTAGDALYPTKLAPWSVFLSGESGVAPQPAYDPLAFAIEEAHARGLQLHAWFNPFRARLGDRPLAASHVARVHPSWVRKYGTQTWMDPGLPEVRKAVLDAVLEVVDRYDIDGIHIDDYFYPYRESETITRRVGKGKKRRTVRIRRELDFPDATSWKKYGRPKGFTDRAAWRRANVDDFVKRMYAGVKARKPNVLVGISPFGIWRSGVPSGVTGLDAYAEIYADSRRWLREGWLDYVVPQLYWELDGAQARFQRLDEWWHSENPKDRHIWPGLFTEREGTPRLEWATGEIAGQIEWLRANDARVGASNGHVHFRIGAMPTDSSALGWRLHSEVYRALALVPASPWLDAGVPGAPTLLRDSLGLVAAPTPGPVTAWWLVQRRYGEEPWRSQLVRATPGARILSNEELGDVPSLWVTAIGADGRASAPVYFGGEASKH